MRSKIVLSALVSLLLLYTLFMSQSISPVAAANIIRVPEDYPTIQDAITAAEDGDTVQVAPGTYHEHLTIHHKTLTLLGEDKSTTIIDGGGNGSIILVTAGTENIYISGFTIQNGGTFDQEEGPTNAGINQQGIGITIVDNNILNSGIGILAVGNPLGENNISNNLVIAKDCGIWVEWESQNTLTNNTVKHNNQGGIILSKCFDCIIEGNTVLNQTEAPTACGISVDNSNNISIKHNKIENNRLGIIFSNCSTSLLQSNIASNNHAGIILDPHSNNNTLSQNLILQNEFGLQINYSNNNTITYNNIFDNILVEHGVGIALTNSYDNIICHNNFMDNPEQLRRYGSTNMWDNGSEGNFWNDYTGIDQNIDGVGDTDLPHLGVDYYPLIGPCTHTTLPITVSFEYSPFDIHEYEAANFDATSSYAEYTSIAKYTWNFGDGNITTTTSPTIKHAYTTPNSYNVNLTITDEFGFKNSTTKTLTILEDNEPPTTTDDYDEEWHISDCTIRLTATDHESGLAEIYYKLNDGSTRTVSSDGQPFITYEGADNKLEYWSVDKAGNVEDVKVLSGIKLDKTNPIIGIPVTTPEDDIQENQDVMIALDVSDSVSGVESVTLSYSVNNGSTWENLQMNLNSTNGLWQATIPSQEIWTIVNYKVLCYDNAGNSAFSNGTDLYYEYQVVPELPFQIILQLFLTATALALVFRKRLSRRIS